MSVRLDIKPLAGDDLLPARATAGAAGLDLRAAEALTLAPGDIARVPCGVAVAIPPGYEGQVRARSGLSSRHGVAPVNAPGTIDADYRGEVAVPLINLGREPYAVERGERIAQLVICPVPEVAVNVVDDLPPTARGSAGFGSTGKF